MIEKRCETYEVKIYAGFRVKYGKKVHKMGEITDFLQKYCDKIPFSFSVYPVDYIYHNGSEPGCCINIINYPRFPKTREELKGVAYYIASNLLDILEQERISMVCSDETIMLEKEIKNVS